MGSDGHLGVCGAVTALAGLLSDRDRRRLAERLAELRAIDAAMRKPGGMPAVPEPPGLHQMAAAGPERPRTQEAGQHQPKRPAND